jgi:hypothetical protein
MPATADAVIRLRPRRPNDKVGALAVWIASISSNSDLLLWN